MSWIQENKFVAGLAGVTAVVTVAVLYVGLSQGGAYDEKLEQYQDLKGQYATLEKSKPYPSAENQSDREEGIEEYASTISDVRKLVLGYRPEKLEKMTPEQFKDIQVKMDTDLHELFTKAGTELPDDCLFGFEEYSASAVKAGATAKLYYELGAIQWMLTKLADVKPDAISNIRRVELPEESGKVVVAEPQPRRKGRARSAARGNDNQKAAGRAYELMPMEISFTASESAVREFVVALVNSKKYFYSIRGVRILSEKQSAPNQRDASFPIEKAAGGNDLFSGLDGFVDEADAEEDILGEGEAEVGEDSPVLEAPAEPAAQPGELTLKQVLGNEKLHVHLCLDIVLIEKKTGSQPKQGRSE